MSLFDWLLVAHLVGDFLMQTPNMARRKEESWAWLSAHVAVYMAPVTVVVVCYTVSHGLPARAALVAWLLLAGSHALLDRRGFIRWWTRHVLGVPDDHWLFIVVDQVFHIVVLALVAQALVLFGNQGNLGR